MLGSKFPGMEVAMCGLTFPFVFAAALLVCLVALFVYDFLGIALRALWEFLEPLGRRR